WAIPKGFIPSEDRDQITIRTDAAQDISFGAMAAHQAALAEIVQSDANVLRFMSTIGGFRGTNSGFMFVVLKPRSERALNMDQVIEELRPKLAKVPGVRAFPTVPPTIQVGGRQANALYQLTLAGTDPDALYRYGEDLEQRVRALPGLADVSSDLLLKNPQLNLQIDRDQ